MKKLPLQILISFILILALAAPIFVFGYTKEDEGEAALLQEGELDIESADLSGYTLPLRSASTVEDCLYDGLISLSDRINITSYSVSVNDIGAVYSGVINSHPDLFFVSGAYSISYSPATNTVLSIAPSYKLSYDEAMAALDVFHSGADKALAEVDSSMNDIQKALTIHDYMISVADYPNVFDEEGNYSQALDNDENHNAYGFFKNYRVVCQGFTLAYIYLMNRLGIPCVYVASDTMNHSWNLIEIDGAWYNVDVTFDNHDYDMDTNTYGSVLHSYFLKSDSYFSGKTGIHWHYGGVPDNGCAAVSTLYDTAFWDDVTSRIYTIGGDYYYLDPPNAASVYTFLKRRTPSGEETNLCTGFTSLLVNYSGGFRDENGNPQSYTFRDRLARLTYLDNRFYVAASKNIYSVVPTGNGYTRYDICTLSDYPSGLGVNGKNNLIYHTRNTENALYELDKYEFFKDHITAEKGVNYNNYPDINLDGVINGKDAASIIHDINN